MMETCFAPATATKSIWVSSADVLTAWRAGLWRFRLAQSSPVIAGVTDRSADLETLKAQFGCKHAFVFAEQIHGASLAAIGPLLPVAGVPVLSGAMTTAQESAPKGETQSMTQVGLIPGCDGLTTNIAGIVLVIRTADCLPIFVWDSVQGVVGLIHAGWRALASGLPMRLISFVRQNYHSRPEDLWAGIGPAIHACCYEVGRDLEQSLGPFVRNVDGRLMCDLIGCAAAQLLASGMRPRRIVDCNQCTACETGRWYSVRREGETTGRLCSFIMLSPIQTGSEIRRQKSEVRGDV